MADCLNANRFRKIDHQYPVLQNRFDLLFDNLGFSIFGQNPRDTYWNTCILLFTFYQSTRFPIVLLVANLRIRNRNVIENPGRNEYSYLISLRSHSISPIEPSYKRKSIFFISEGIPITERAETSKLRHVSTSERIETIRSMPRMH